MAAKGLPMSHPARATDIADDAEPRTLLTLSAMPRLAGVAGVVALGTGFAMISPPPAVAQTVAPTQADLPAAFTRVPAAPMRVADLAMIFPAAGPGHLTMPGSAPPPPIGSSAPSPPGSLVLLDTMAPFQPTVGGVTDSSAGAALSPVALDYQAPVFSQLPAAPPPASAVTAPAPSTVIAPQAPPATSAAAPPLVLADSSQPGSPPSGPALQAAPAQVAPRPPVTETHVGQIVGCYYLYCGTAAQTTDGMGNYNYLVGAGFNISGKPIVASLARGQAELLIPSLTDTTTVGVLATKSFGSGPITFRLTGQAEIPYDQIPTAIATGSGPLGQLAMWAFPDYFPPLTPTLNGGASFTIKGSALLNAFPGLAKYLPDSASKWLDTFQYSRGGMFSYNSATGEWTTRTTDQGKLQIAGSDGYIVGFVKVPSQSSLADMYKQAADLLSGKPTQDPSQQPAAQPTPTDTPQPAQGDTPQPAQGETPQPAQGDSGQQPPAAADQPSPADSGQQPPAATGQLAPADAGQQPPPPVGQATPPDSGQPAATGQPSPADSGQQPPPATGQPSPVSPGETAPAPVGQQSSTDGRQPALATRSVSLADGAYAQASPGSEASPAPIGAELQGAVSSAGNGSGPSSDAAPATNTSGGGTTGGNSWSGTTSSSGGTSSYGTEGSSTSTSQGGATSGATSYAGTSTGATSTGGTTSAGTSGGGTSYGGTSTGGTSSGGTTSYAGTSSGGTASGGGTSSGGTTSTGTTSGGTSSG
jgi:hypothetical protein